MKAGSHATRAREPGQAREGAAISGSSRAPWGSPAGAPRPSTLRFGSVEGGCTARFGFSLVELIVDILVSSAVFLISLSGIFQAMAVMNRIKEDMDRTIDLVMAVNFIRDEIHERMISNGLTRYSENFITFEGLSSGRIRTITYRIVKRKGMYRMYRHADGEGNNVVLDWKGRMWFEPSKDLLTIHIGDLIFHVSFPKER